MNYSRQFVKANILFFLISEIGTMLFLFFGVYSSLGLSFEQVVRGMGIAVIVCAMAFVVVTMILARILKPIWKMELTESRLLTESEKASLIKIESFLSVFFLVVNIVGYAITTPLAIVGTVMAEGLLRWSTVRFAIITVISAPLIGSIQNIFFSFRMQKLKEVAQVYEFSFETKRVSLGKRLIFTFFSFCVFAVVSIGLVASAREELVSGLDHIALLLNEKSYEEPTGYYAELMKKATVSSDPEVKALALKLKEYWRTTAANNTFAIVGFCCGILIVLFGAVYISVSDLTAHLKSVRTRLKTIVEEGGDLTKFIVKTANNEIGEIQVYINQFISQLREDIVAVKTAAKKIADSSIVLTSSATQLAASAEEQSSSNEEVASTTEEFTETLEAIKNNIEDENANIIRIAENIDALTQNIRIIVDYNRNVQEKMNQCIQTADEGSQRVNDSGNRTSEISKSVGNIMNKIEEVKKESENIDEILQVINRIADSTNMLGMNAAIEAAHSGEFGKGFAVVAAEIRTLAQNSSSSSEEIARLIGNIKRSIDDAVNITQGGGKMTSEAETLSELGTQSLRNIITEIRGVDGILTHIASSTHQQESAIMTVLEGIESLQSLSHQVSTSILEQTHGANQISQTMQALAASLEHNVQSAEKLAVLSEELSGESNRLSDIVNRFKIE